MGQRHHGFIASDVPVGELARKSRERRLYKGEDATTEVQNEVREPGSGLREKAKACKTPEDIMALSTGRHVADVLVNALMIVRLALLAFLSAIFSLAEKA